MNIEEDPRLLIVIMGLPVLLAFSFIKEGFGMISRYDPSGWAKVLLGVVIILLVFFVYFMARANPFW